MLFEKKRNYYLRRPFGKKDVFETRKTTKGLQKYTLAMDKLSNTGCPTRTFLVVRPVLLCLSFAKKHL